MKKLNLSGGRYDRTNYGFVRCIYIKNIQKKRDHWKSQTVLFQFSSKISGWCWLLVYAILLDPELF